jgi:hypothetical protein
MSFSLVAIVSLVIAHFCFSVTPIAVLSSNPPTTRLDHVRLALDYTMHSDPLTAARTYVKLRVDETVAIVVVVYAL